MAYRVTEPFTSPAITQRSSSEKDTDAMSDVGDASSVCTMLSGYGGTIGKGNTTQHASSASNTKHGANKRRRRSSDSKSLRLATIAKRLPKAYHPTSTLCEDELLSVI